MAVYLNSASSYVLYRENVGCIYFADKPEIIKELVLIADSIEDK